MSLVRAPWTPEQVRNLNDYQQSGYCHPFTCGTCRADLVADPGGWRCPTGCDHRQDWAHSFMADGSWRSPPHSLLSVLPQALRERLPYLNLDAHPDVHPQNNFLVANLGLYTPTRYLGWLQLTDDHVALFPAGANVRRAALCAIADPRFLDDLCAAIQKLLGPELV